MVKVSGSLSMRVKHSFRRQHIFAGQHFASLARAIEVKGISQGDEKSLQEHRSYVTAAILSAVTYLESSINELYHEAENGDQTTLQGLDGRAFQMLDQFWREIERASILHKYQTALLVAGKSRFDQGNQPYQDVDSLIKLRDALVHYKPEWNDEQGRHQNLQERLERRFKPNPLLPSGSLWFPHLCLGAACAEWAVDVASSFSNEFSSRMGIPPRH
jgi:hypothetical protein